MINQNKIPSVPFSITHLPTCSCLSQPPLSKNYRTARGKVATELLPQTIDQYPLCQHLRKTHMFPYARHEVTWAQSAPCTEMRPPSEPSRQRPRPLARFDASASSITPGRTNWPGAKLASPSQTTRSHALTGPSLPPSTVCNTTKGQGSEKSGLEGRDIGTTKFFETSGIVLTQRVYRTANNYICQDIFVSRRIRQLINGLILKKLHSSKLKKKKLYLKQLKVSFRPT